MLDDTGTGGPLAPTLTVAAAVTVAMNLPVFLTAALWVQVREDVDAGSATLGLLVAGHFLAAGLLTARLGRLADRVGPETAVRVGTAGAGVLLLLIATTARSVVVLGVLLVLSGVAQALGHPSTSLFLAQRVPIHAQGLAFAIRQSGTPVATLLGGAAVPLIGLTVGWRWAFVGAGMAALAASAAVPRRSAPAEPGRPGHIGADNHTPPPQPPRSRPARPEPYRPLLLLSLGAAVGGTAAGSLLSFYVSGAVDSGMSESAAGWALTAGSAGVVVSRMWQGQAADRRGGRHLPVIATMMGLGVLGHALLSVGQPALHVVAVPLAFCAGWAWPGLYSYAVVRIHPLTPGAAAGIAQAGAFIGGVIGPLAFGAIAEAAGYRWAWAFSATASATGASLFLLARWRYLLASQARSAPVATGA